MKNRFLLISSIVVCLGLTSCMELVDKVFDWLSKYEVTTQPEEDYGITRPTQYKGVNITPGESFEDLLAVLGTPDRRKRTVSGFLYVWDEPQIMLWSDVEGWDNPEGRETLVDFAVGFYYKPDQLPIQTDIDIEKCKQWGVNTEHLFSFDDCSMTYNGQHFMLGEPITVLFNILGMPTRKKETSLGHMYFWDEIGLGCRGERFDWRDNNSPETLTGFEVSFNLNMTGYEEKDIGNNIHKRRTREQMISNNPYTFFQGKILVHGVPLGRGMNIKEFQKENKNYWDNPFYPRLYSYNSMNCDYIAIAIPDYKVLKYTIYVSDDHSDIEFFMVGTNDYLSR